MGCAPGLTKRESQKLKSIDSALVPKWNPKRNYWEIWYESVGRKPYIIDSVADQDGGYLPIDERTYERLRKATWYNRKIMQHLKDIIYSDELAERRKEAQELDDYRMMARELRRTVQMMDRDLGLASGKSKIPYSPGFGEGLKDTGKDMGFGKC